MGAALAPQQTVRDCGRSAGPGQATPASARGFDDAPRSNCGPRFEPQEPGVRRFQDPYLITRTGLEAAPGFEPGYGALQAPA